MQAKEIFKILDKKYQFANQESWDQCGFCENSKSQVSKVLVCLDLTNQVIAKAIKQDINLIISHHPLFTDQEFPSYQQSIAMRKTLKANGISTIFLHTAFDRSVHGMNIALAKQLKLNEIKLAANQNYAYGTLTKTLTLKQFALQLKSTFKLDYVKYQTSNQNTKIKSVAICGGSGSSLMYEPFDIKTDVFVTSDIKHHAWMDANEVHTKFIDVNHHIENIFVDVLACDLKHIDTKIKVLKVKNTNNFSFI